MLDASQQPLRYSSADGTSLELIDTAAMLPMIIFMDPPSHDRQRKLVSRAFTPRAISDLEPFVRGHRRPVPRRRSSSRAAATSSRSSRPSCPMNVIMELLGVPEADRNQVRKWMDASLERIEEPPYIPDRAIESMAHADGYWSAFVADQRGHPNGALTSRLCDVEITDDDGATTRLSDDEVIGFLMLIGAAGTETVMKLLANAVVLFQRNPGEWAKVLDDPDVRAERGGRGAALLGAVAVPGPRPHRRRSPCTASRCRRSARVLLLTGSANRDEREYEDPDRFDIDRPNHVALGLGHGVHFCLGASLARLESRIALEEFAARFPQYEVDEANMERVHMSNVHGFSHVPFSAGTSDRRRASVSSR